MRNKNQLPSFIALYKKKKIQQPKSDNTNGCKSTGGILKAADRVLYLGKYGLKDNQQ